MNQDENRNEIRLSCELLAKNMTIPPAGKNKAEQLVVAFEKPLDTEF